MSCGSAEPSTIELALVHHLAFVHQDVLLLGDQLFVHTSLGVGDLQAVLALGLLAEADGAGDFGQQCPHPSANGLRTARPRAAGRP
jgi:hypothetical protein